MHLRNAKWTLHKGLTKLFPNSRFVFCLRDSKTCRKFDSRCGTATIMDEDINVSMDELSGNGSPVGDKPESVEEAESTPSSALVRDGEGEEGPLHHEHSAGETSTEAGIQDTALQLSKYTMDGQDETDVPHDVDVTSQPGASKKAKKKANKQIHREGKASVDDSKSEQALLSPAPLIALLIGDDFETHKLAILVDKILNMIGKHISAHPHIHLLGRTPDGFRIDYTPTTGGVTGIKSRLQKATAGQSAIQKMDLLLKPLVKKNREAFQETKNIKNRSKIVGGYGLDNRSYRSVWLHNQKLFTSVHPISWYRRKDVVAAVVQAYCKQCGKVDPDSLLLKNPSGEELGVIEDEKREHVREWSLYDNTSGFASKLLSCFDGPERSSEDYEDLIERMMYLFRSANQGAVYGPKETGKVPK
jgi:hypothetical protein